MTTHDQGLRKAAILIDTLDQASADTLLERLTDDSADRIRRKLLGLESVEPAERRSILDELGGCPPAASHEDETDAIQDKTSESQVSDRGASNVYDHRERAAGNAKREQPPAERISDQVDNSATTTDPASMLPESEPFAFLNDTPADVLATYFADEHPQAVSIVLAHLAPGRAAEYLATLSGERRADVLRRLARLDETDADIISDVERGLQILLADRMRADQRRPIGLATLEAILNAVDDDQRKEFLGHLRPASHESMCENGGVQAAAGAHQERGAASAAQIFHTRIAATEFPQTAGNLLDALAAPVCSPRGPDASAPARSLTQGTETVFEFEDFADLDDTALARIFRAADPQVALLALCGAGRDLVDRILGRLPLREARALRRQIEQLGPTRLRDIESAQQRLAELARRMADEGQIQVPRNRRFTVAA